MWAAAGKVIGVGLSKQVDAHITPCALNARSGNTGFSACSPFVSSPFLHFHFSLLEWECLLCATVCWKSVTWFLNLWGLTSKKTLKIL
jgi:hypothetical protein